MDKVTTGRMEAPAAAYQRFLDRGVFALPACTRCKRFHYPPRVLCPWCGASALTWNEVGGYGTIYSLTVVSPRDADAYAVVLVDLDEGVRLMSNAVDYPASGARIGDRVRAEIGTRDGVAVPLFEVVDHAHG